VTTDPGANTATGALTLRRSSAPGTRSLAGRPWFCPLSSVGAGAVTGIVAVGYRLRPRGERGSAAGSKAKGQTNRRVDGYKRHRHLAAHARLPVSLAPRPDQPISITVLEFSALARYGCAKPTPTCGRPPTRGNGTPARPGLPEEWRSPEQRRADPAPVAAPVSRRSDPHDARLRLRRRQRRSRSLLRRWYSRWDHVMVPGRGAAGSL
jgi:hypothetical protein